MNSVTVSFRTDKEVKQKAESLFEELGLNMSTAVNMFLRAVIRNNGIPFELKKEEFNAETKAALDEAMRGEGFIGPFDTFADFLESLNAED